MFSGYIVVLCALADPTRRQILSRLAEGEATVGDLAAPHQMSAPAISRHLKVLEKAGLIERQVDAQWRRCRLKPEALQAASNWITFYREFWQNKFDALDDYLKKPSHRNQAGSPESIPATTKEDSKNDENNG